MSSTEVINDQMEKMRVELANANQQIGIIMECLEVQAVILKKIPASPEGRLLTEAQYNSLLELNGHMHSACKRA